MKDNEIGMFDAKTHLSDIIREVMAGKRFFITRRGKRVAEIRPIPEDKKDLVRGCASNPGYRMSDDFDAPIEGMEDLS